MHDLGCLCEEPWSGFTLECLQIRFDVLPRGHANQCTGDRVRIREAGPRGSFWRAGFGKTAFGNSSSGASLEFQARGKLRQAVVR